MSEMQQDRRPAFFEPAGNPESVSMKPLSVIALSSAPDARREIVAAIEGAQAHIILDTRLPGRDELPQLLESQCDVLIVNVDEDCERALEIVEAACGLRSDITVMVHSRSADRELVVRSMRAGAREFLTDPLSSNSVAEALVRASVRRGDLKVPKKPSGKTLVFVGAKGGSGVTTVAANFAVALAKESAESVVLVDLNLQLGDAALTLGVSGDFSTLSALQNETRLDSELIAKLLVSHSSGLKILAAPDYLATGDEVKFLRAEAVAIMKMINVLRQNFAWVVVDGGSQFGSYAPSLFAAAETVYLVTQVSVAELRNCNRVIAAHFAATAGNKLEVVLNRFALRPGEINEQSIAKALMLPSITDNWKIPNNYQEVRDAQNEATALAMKDGAVSRILGNMARSACGKAAVEIKKRKFGIFRKRGA